MAHFYLIGGHGEGDPGAVGNGYKEYDLARKFNDLLAKYLKLCGAKVTIYNKNRDMFQRTKRGQGLNVFGVNGRIVIETHLNSFNKTSNGTETLIASGLSADKYDKAINNTLSKYFTARGIKERSDLLNMNVAKKRGINYRLVELCFISNKNDVTKLVANMDKIAKDMAEALTGAKAGASTSKPVVKPVTPKPKPAPKPKEIRAYVKPGLTMLTRWSASLKGKQYLKKTSKSKGLLVIGYVQADGYMWIKYKTAIPGKYAYSAYYKLSDPDNKFYTIK